MCCTVCTVAKRTALSIHRDPIGGFCASTRNFAAVHLTIMLMPHDDEGGVVCGVPRNTTFCRILTGCYAHGSGVDFWRVYAGALTYSVRVVSRWGQIFGDDMEEDYELGEALRGDITDNPLEIYMRVRRRRRDAPYLEQTFGIYMCT